MREQHAQVRVGQANAGGGLGAGGEKVLYAEKVEKKGKKDFGRN